MGLREKLNGQPLLTGGVVLTVAVIAIFYAARTGLGPARDKPATRAFFSTDDGKTWFSDDIKKYPPFQTADGKEALGAMVVSCKGGKDPFVTYLWRYNAEGKAQLEQGKGGTGTAMAREFKKPGKPNWVKQTDFMNASQVTAMVCPPGEEDLVAIDP